MQVKLVMFKRDGQRKDLPVTRKTTTIGRGEDCSLRIPLLSISRRHCELIKTDDELRVRDLASSNGTHVNNRRVNETVLKAGDRLSIGPAIFTVQIDGQPEEIAPARAKPARAPVQAQGEEIVELQASESSAEFDPIAALEALAGDYNEEEEEGQKES